MFEHTAAPPPKNVSHAVPLGLQSFNLLTDQYFLFPPTTNACGGTVGRGACLLSGPGGAGGERRQDRRASQRRGFGFPTLLSSGCCIALQKAMPQATPWPVTNSRLVLTRQKCTLHPTWWKLSKESRYHKGTYSSTIMQLKTPPITNKFNRK